MTAQHDREHELAMMAAWLERVATGQMSLDDYAAKVRAMATQEGRAGR